MPVRSAAARLLIADENPFARIGLQAMLEGADDLEVVGEAGNGAELVYLCHALQPDMVITDVRMPVMDGLEATAAIRSVFPRLPVLMLTLDDIATCRVEAAGAGADAILSKHTPRAELLRCVRSLLSCGR
jgi:DNA-binding NarL/FixJ family response regulator